MALVELRKNIADRFFRRRSTPSTENMQVFPDTILSKNILKKLPFDIAVTGDGYTLSRVGEPFSADDGTRVFIVGKDELDKFYQENHGNGDSPKLFYKFLKKIDSLGRLLTREKDGVIRIDPEKMPDYYLIVKKVENETKKRFDIPDLMRLRFSPKKGFETVITERKVPLVKGKSVNLTAATNDVTALCIREPWLTEQTQEDQERWIELLKAGGYSKLDIEKIKIQDEQVRNHTILNSNMLVIKPLREQQGSVSTPPISADIHQDREGNFFVKINHESGVDGVMIDGVMRILDKDEKFIDVPIINLGQSHSNLKLYFYTGSTYSRRQGLELGIRREKNNVFVDFISGVAELDSPPYDPDAGLLKHRSLKEIELAEQVKLEAAAREKREKLKVIEEELVASADLIVSTRLVTGPIIKQVKKEKEIKEEDMIRQLHGLVSVFSKKE